MQQVNDWCRMENIILTFNAYPSSYFGFFQNSLITFNLYKDLENSYEGLCRKRVRRRIKTWKCKSIMNLKIRPPCTYIESQRFCWFFERYNFLSLSALYEFPKIKFKVNMKDIERMSLKEWILQFWKFL